MPRRNFKTLILMPYMPLEAMLKVNNIILWSYRHRKDELITDSALKAHLDRLVSCYKYHNGRPIQNPAVISINEVNFANPTFPSIAKIETLKNILLFISILENNQWSFVTSDNFEVIYQRFSVGNDGISTRAGAIHSIMTGGYTINNLSFIKPEYVHIPTLSSPRIRVSILNALADAMKSSPTDRNKSQIIQSLNLFFNAHHNSSEISWASRILSMVVAFELLFGTSSRQDFRANIQRYSLYNNPFSPPSTHSYPIMNTQTGRLRNNEDLTLNQIWADEFYKLRHKIIHGDTVYDSDFIFNDLLNITSSRNHHFYIAVNFYVVCVLNKLIEIGYKNIPHWVIHPGARTQLFAKNILGVQNELFKIVDVDVYDALRN